MKKLIGLLGAAGLLIPSAAVAGNITNTVGSDALRVTGASTSLTFVDVSSDIHRNNTVGIAGANWGHSMDASAENLSYGDRDMDYEYGRRSGQGAGNIAGDIDAEGQGTLTETGNYDYNEHSYSAGGGLIHGDVTHTESVTNGTEYETAKGCSWWGCHEAETPATPMVTENNTQGYVAGGGGGIGGESGEENFTETTHASGSGSLHGAATGNGTIDGASAASWGHGTEHFVDGAGTVSYDGYANGYAGVLHENGLTTTNIHAVTSASSTERGFKTSSFQDTSFN
jgi:hypothetical protein